MPNVAKWRLLPEEVFAQYVAESRSFYELAEKIGYQKMGGGTQSSLKRAVQERGLDTSHFLGQAWNKNNYNYDVFTKNSPKKRGKSTLNPLIHLRGRKCECCGLKTWLDEPINLQIHHVNGDRTDNRLENLQLLCPNCHSYTESFCNNKNKISIEEERFVEALQKASSIHSALKQLGISPSSGNYERARRLIEQYNIEHLKS